MACALARPEVADEAKRYLIDFAYARAPRGVDGDRFHAAAGKASLAPALATYEREQYETFQKWKPLVAELDAIRTAAEMHRRVADIQRLFTAEHPMLLADVLTFETSELHASAPLRQSKARAVLRLVRACAGRGAYYADALDDARLFVREQEAYTRGHSLPETQRMGFPAREYQELRRLLGLDG
jgi:hypothetical protein